MINVLFLFFLASMTVTKIPVLDLSKYNQENPNDENSKEFLRELFQAMTEIGFFYVKNHNVPIELQQRSFEVIKSFFKLPLEEKLEIELKNSPHFRGYSCLCKYKLSAFKPYFLYS